MTRHEIEKDIITRTVKALIAAGLPVSVTYDGENSWAVDSTDVEEILEEATAADECHLETTQGEVFLVLGNDGYDVINDYSTSLEKILKPVNDYIDETYY